MPKRSQKAARRYASKAGTRQKRRHPRHQLAAAPPPPSDTIAKAAVPPRPTMTARAPAQPSQLASYQYLRGELRRIALLAGGIIVVLVVLAFVLG